LNRSHQGDGKRALLEFQMALVVLFQNLGLDELVDPEIDDALRFDPEKVHLSRSFFNILNLQFLLTYFTSGYAPRLAAGNLMLGFQRGAKHPFGQGRGSMPRPRSRAPRNVRREFTVSLLSFTMSFW
jgi:hypothetical protein